MGIELISQRDMGFLRESELFRDLSDDVLRAVLLQSSYRAYSAGDRIFEQGDPGDYLAIVKSGVVEISARTTEGNATVLAYLGGGECVGEVALLTGSPRTATARVPERAELVTITKDVFEDLIMNFPMFLKQLCVILARRLERTIGKVPTTTQTKQLTGQLRYFDLALMLQTLIDSKQSGRMSLDITTDGRQQHAELYFSEGTILWAKMGALFGSEAVYQLFQMKLDGTFNFGGAGTERQPQGNVFGTSMSLLLEAARLQDELNQFRSRLPDTARVFRPKVAQLGWTDLDTIDIASDVWDALASGASLQSLLDESEYCSAKVYQVVSELLRTDQIH